MNHSSSKSLYSKSIAVVTAYYKEPKEVIDRVVASVKDLEDCGYSIRHYLIADGHPIAIDDNNISHVVLPNSHHDYGDTPRLVGASLAIREGCYGLMFLDADNFVDSNHIKLCLDKHHESNTDLIIAKRYLVRPDRSRIDFNVTEDKNLSHVDTNCFVFFREALFEAIKWIRIPRQFSSYGDRYFWDLLRRNPQMKYSVVNTPSVAYTCISTSIYRWINEIPPPGAKPDLDPTPVDDWFNGLSTEDQSTLKKRLEISK